MTSQSVKRCYDFLLLEIAATGVYCLWEMFWNSSCLLWSMFYFRHRKFFFFVFFLCIVFCAFLYVYMQVSVFLWVCLFNFMYWNFLLLFIRINQRLSYCFNFSWPKPCSEDWDYLMMTVPYYMIFPCHL